MGMATRSGCGAQCLKVDMPCTGCGGATPNQKDMGSGMITALAAILNLDGEPGRYTEEENRRPHLADQGPGGHLLPVQPAVVHHATEGDEEMKEINIDPITRLEGHGSVSIFLNDEGEVENAYLKVPELRGFEAFCIGRPAELMPIITTRICGVCPVAHHLASVKTLDAAFHVGTAFRGQEAARAPVHGLSHR